MRPSNVNNLIRAWELPHRRSRQADAQHLTLSKFQASLSSFLPSTRSSRCIPETGAQTWRFDARIDTEQRPADRYNCRGVAYWGDIEAAKHAICRSRIIIGTNDACLIALDAKTGSPCPDLAENGQLKIDIGVELE
jgi:quinoprotein glucose dehydrogenase